MKRERIKKTIHRHDRLIGAVVLIAGTVLFLGLAYGIGRPLLELASSTDSLREYLQTYGPFGFLAFFLIQFLQGFLPVPLELTAIAGGYIFGPVFATLLTLLSIIASTAAIFFFTRAFGTRLLQLFFPRSQQKLMRLLSSDRRRGMITWIVFLVPGLPKRLFVFSAGLVPQSFGKFLLVSTVARMPSILACTFGGHALGEQNYGFAGIILAVVVVFSVAGLLLYRRLNAKKEQKK